MSSSSTSPTSPPKKIRLGILVPSSNTALEPLTTALLASPSLSPLVISAHFTRIPVTAISLAPAALAQFALPTLLAAARLLADAHVDVIGWSGTSAGWLGFAHDETLCAAIEAETGIPATTSTLGLNRALEKLGVRRLGLVTPYRGDVQEAIVRNYREGGFEVVAERHLEMVTNEEIAGVGVEVLGRMVKEVVQEEEAGGKGEDGKGGKVQAVTTFCTNLLAAQMAEEWEAVVGVPVLDSVTTVVWDMLRIAKVDTRQVKGWGSIFQLD